MKSLTKKKKRIKIVQRGARAKQEGRRRALALHCCSCACLGVHRRPGGLWVGRRRRAQGLRLPGRALQEDYGLRGVLPRATIGPVGCLVRSGLLDGPGWAWLGAGVSKAMQHCPARTTAPTSGSAPRPRRRIPAGAEGGGRGIGRGLMETKPVWRRREEEGPGGIARGGIGG